MQKIRERFIAGAVQAKKAFIGSNANRGIATMASGTGVASVAAEAVVSGSVIQLTPYMYSTAMNSGQNLFKPMVASVSAGRFLIVAAGSVCPTANAPIAWSIIK